MLQGIQLDIQLCHQCGGRCCQGHPGLWSEPQRFFSIFASSSSPSPEELIHLLQTQQLELKDLGGVLIPAPLNTEKGCIALRADGCSYSTTKRPCQCLALIPDLETLLDDQIHCSLPPEFGSGSSRENWRPFQALLKQAKEMLTADNC